MRVVLCMVVTLVWTVAAAQEATKMCSADYYQCKAGGCVPWYWTCDGTTDCPDGDDENGCSQHDPVSDERISDHSKAFISSSSPVCSGYYYCMNGGTIPCYWVCDGTYDCPYGDDELTCSSSDTSSATPIDVSTSLASSSTDCPGGYQCMHGDCIPWEWVCDGMEDCPLYGDDEDGCSSESSSPPPSETTTLPPKITCDNPFDLVYNSCILIDLFTTTTWDEARYFCQMFDSDLVVLDDMNFYSKLLDYITSRGLDGHNYWVGASDRDREGTWRWLDNSYVQMGPPLWAIYGTYTSYEMEPRQSDESNQDCAFLDRDRFLYMSDMYCDATFATICQHSGVPKRKTRKATIHQGEDASNEEGTSKEEEKNEEKRPQTMLEMMVEMIMGKRGRYVSAEQKEVEEKKSEENIA